MYAIIRAGGKQTKVREGDIIDVERIKAADDEVSFTPLLLVADDGEVVSDRASLEKATVSAKVIGESRGEKIDIFKYKAKTGYRRRQGHRQTYTRLEVTKIATSGKAAKKSTSKKSSAAAAEEKAPAAEQAAEKKPAAKEPAAKKKSSDKEE